MEKRKVHNLIIVDASSSMDSIYRQALAGINETIKTIQRVQGNNPFVKQYLTLLSFSNWTDELQYVYHHRPINEVEVVTEKDYCLRGMTALYDAIGISVTNLRKYVGENDKALVTIITDGEENNSMKWKQWEVKELIDELRTQGWVFTYIGANQDVEREAEKMGVVNSMQFDATIEGTVRMFEKEGEYRQRWNERMNRGEEELEKGYFADEVVTSYNRITPERIDRLAENEVFVFGSNIEGHHNGGAAKAALQRFGAKYGQGIGFHGQSYAIPSTVSLQMMEAFVDKFIDFAQMHPEMRFLVTPIGCGNAGHSPAFVARLFRDAMYVPNICLPKLFWTYLAL